MIIVDSREKSWSHIKDYFDENGIEYRDRIKLDVGDYFNTEYPYVVVDRKSGLQEVCSNLVNGKNNFYRFSKECKRAKDRHIKLIVLVEGTNCRSLDDVTSWKSKYVHLTGDWLKRQMRRMEITHGIEWKFCRKTETARRILELTHYDNGRNKAKRDDAGADGTIRNQDQK